VALVGVPTKRTRCTKDEIWDIRDAILDVAELDHPLTIRGLFYRLVSDGVVPKDEAKGYAVVQRQCTVMRRDGSLPYSWLVDEGREAEIPLCFDSPNEAIAYIARHYRRNPWSDADELVEVWCEKAGLLGVLREVTQRYCVPIVACHGFSSLSLLYETSQRWAEGERQVTAYYLGDHDPSGVLIDPAVVRTIEEMDDSVGFSLVRLAVTPDQVVDMRLPTRPTKRAGNRHAVKFVGDSVEVDAIPPRVLRNMVEGAILSHLDQGALDRLKRQEEEERGLLEELAR